ncbi:MAG: hypothetical protein J7L91_01315, partial [Candidatus Korarchaeota archaeon]|nr:hypothetical protein [Candidatus Korarchaeota archaeon]
GTVMIGVEGRSGPLVIKDESVLMIKPREGTQPPPSQSQSPTQTPTSASTTTYPAWSTATSGRTASPTKPGPIITSTTPTSATEARGAFEVTTFLLIVVALVLLAAGAYLLIKGKRH